MADPFAPPETAPRPRPDPAPRTEPANPGIFWTMAAIGIGLSLLGTLLRFFTVVDEMDSEDVAPTLFSVLGVILLAGGLAVAAVLQRGLAMPWRVALILGAGYFATTESGMSVFALFRAALGGPFF